MKNQLQNEISAVCEAVNELIASDHFPETVQPDFLREAVRLYPLRGGKRLRPVLTMWSCGAVGGDPRKALNAAAAVEIYHNWTLVHDDIIDCDELRRGAPTCHSALRKQSADAFGLSPERAEKYGNSMAILAADIQQAWAIDMLLRSETRGVSLPVILSMTRRMGSFLGRGLISGEALDVEFEYRKAMPSLEELSEMIRGKTGTLLAYSAECGGMIGLDTQDADRPTIRALSRFAFSLGYAFQLQDDLLGIYGDEQTFGKPICSDFREGKPTVPVLEALNRLDEAGRGKLLSMMRLEHYGQSEIDQIRDILEQCGAKAAVAADAEKASDEALKNLMFLPSTQYRTLLGELAQSLLKRKV